MTKCYLPQEPDVINLEDGYLVNSRGAPPSPNHCTALQEEPSDVQLMSLPSFVAAYVSWEGFGVLVCQRDTVSSSKSPCSPPGAAGLWPEQEHRLRAALSRTADRKCTLSCALFFITIISKIDTCTPLLISTYSRAYAGASLGRAVKISGVWKILKSCSCPRDVVVTATVVQQREEGKFHGSEQRMAFSLFLPFMLGDCVLCCPAAQGWIHVLPEQSNTDAEWHLCDPGALHISSPPSSFLADVQCCEHSSTHRRVLQVCREFLREAVGLPLVLCRFSSSGISKGRIN